MGSDDWAVGVQDSVDRLRPAGSYPLLDEVAQDGEGSSPAGEPEEFLGELAGRPSYTSTRRAFRIIDHVSRSGEQLTVRALAHDLGISASTCYHLIAVLTDQGYIEKLPRNGGYRLGPAIAALSERSRRSASRAAINSALDDLARVTNRPSYFAVLSETDAVVVTHLRTPVGFSLPLGVPQGFSGPSHALALGKILIASGGSTVINRYIEHHDLSAFTERTITDGAKLEVHLKDVRAQGYATDFEEFAENLYCVALPVVDAQGAVCGAVGLGTSAGSRREELKRMVHLARRSAREISLAISGRGTAGMLEGLSY